MQASLYGESYQRGLITIFFSSGSNPFRQWELSAKEGHFSRFLDPEIKTMVTDIRGLNVSTTYMMCPKGSQELGIFMPFFIMIVKNLKMYFSFEVTIRDETNFKRRFRVSNFQSTTQITMTSTVMPMALTEGWNQIQFNLADFCRKVYSTSFKEVVKVKVNANIRIRRIYFADRLIPDEELPDDFRLFYPIVKKSAKKRPEVKEKVSQETLAKDVQKEQQKVPPPQDIQTYQENIPPPEVMAEHEYIPHPEEVPPGEHEIIPQQEQQENIAPNIEPPREVETDQVKPPTKQGSKASVAAEKEASRKTSGTETAQTTEQATETAAPVEKPESQPGQEAPQQEPTATQPEG